MLSKLLISSFRNKTPEELIEESAFSNESVSEDGYEQDVDDWIADDSNDEEISAIVIQDHLDEFHPRTVGLSLSNKDPAKQEYLDDINFHYSNLLDLFENLHANTRDNALARSFGSALSE